MRLVTETIPHLRTVTVGCWIPVGSRHENPNQQGLTHLLEHLLLAGTTSRSAQELFATIESVGGWLNAYTTREYTCLSVKVLTEHLPTALAVLAELLTPATWTEEQFQKEKQTVVHEIEQHQQDLHAIALDWFYQVAFPQQPLGQPVLGTPESVRDFTLKDVEEYRNNHYRANRMVLVAIGDVTHDLFSALAASKFAALPAKPRSDWLRPAHYAGGIQSLEYQSDSVYLLLGWPTCGLQDSDFILTQAWRVYFGGGMSSRLFQRLRQEQALAYHLQVTTDIFRDIGTLRVETLVSARDAHNTTLLIQQEVEGAMESLRLHHVEQVKIQLKSEYWMNQESPEARLEHLARYSEDLFPTMTGFPTIADWDSAILNRIENITPEAMHAYAKTHFTQQMTTISVGPSPAI